MNSFDKKHTATTGKFAGEVIRNSSDIARCANKACNYVRLGNKWFESKYIGLDAARTDQCPNCTENQAKPLTKTA